MVFKRERFRTRISSWKIELNINKQTSCSFLEFSLFLFGSVYNPEGAEGEPPLRRLLQHSEPEH